MKLTPKPQGHNGDEQQAIDSMMQKLKAKGEEVHMMAVTGDAILLEVTLKRQPNSCLRKSSSPVRKRANLRFNCQECEEE